MIQVTNPAPQEILLTKAQVVGEDVMTREHWDGTRGEYVNTQESMLTISFELITTISETKRTAYSLLSFFGDIGGLFDFIILICTPLVGYIVGDRFSYIILRSLYMQNRGESRPPGAYDGFEDAFEDPDDPQVKRKKQGAWLGRTEPYKESWKSQILLNQWVRFLTCRTCPKTKCWKRKKTTSEKIYEKGRSRTEKSLDVRNLIKSQEALKSLMHVLVPSKEKRKLMRLQRRSLVLEPVSSSSDSEDDFTAYKSFYKQF